MASTASVNEVYSRLKDLANKDQRGFITPAVFNNFASIAQRNVFNRLFNSLKQYKRLSKAGFDEGRDKSKRKQIQEDLSYFSYLEEPINVNADGVFEKPDDLYRIISMTTYGSILLGQSTKTNIEIVYDEEKIDRILRSTLSAPSKEFPVALVSNNIEVFPQTLKKISLRYYRQPGSVNTYSPFSRSSSQPYFSFTEAAGVETYDASASRDFELPEHYTNDLIIEIASMIGLTLKDAEIQSFFTNEETQRTQEQGF